MENLAHFFCECPNTARFWQGIHDWVDKIEDTHIASISTKERLLGVPLGFPKGKRINFIVLTAKYYIHRQKLFDKGNLSIIHWLQEFRLRLRIEKCVLATLGKPGAFSSWQKYLDALT